MRENGLIRTTADAESIFDGRTIPAGMKGTVLEARSDGSCLAEFDRVGPLEPNTPV